MICLNKLCVYHNENECTNERVEIDWRGTCKSMIKIRLTAEALDYSKMYTKLLLNNEDYCFNDTTGDFSHMEDEKF